MLQREQAFSGLSSAFKHHIRACTHRVSVWQKYINFDPFVPQPKLFKSKAFVLALLEKGQVDFSAVLGPHRGVRVHPRCKNGSCEIIRGDLQKKLSGANFSVSNLLLFSNFLYRQRLKSSQVLQYHFDCRLIAITL